MLLIGIPPYSSRVGGMRKLFPIYPFGKLLLLVVLFLYLSGSALAGDTLILTTQEWPPYQILIHGTQKGIAVETVKCALKSLRQSYSIHFLPWERAQTEVKTGRAHGFSAASMSEKREAYAQFSTPIAPQKWIWYLRRESRLDPREPNFKKTVRVTATAGSNMGNWLRENGYNLKLQPKKTEQLVKMLQKRRVDAVLANELVFTAALRKLNLKRKTFRKFLGRDKPLGVYFSKAYLENHSGFLKRFNASIRHCLK